MTQHKRYRAIRYNVVLLNCECCSEFEMDEEEFDTIEEAKEFVDDYNTYNILELVDGRWKDIEGN